MAGRVDIRVVGGEDFTRAANALRAVDHTLPGKLRTAMKRSVNPLVRRAKAKVRVLPVEGNSGKSTGLRRRVARGVRVKAGVGRNAYLRITTVMTDPAQAAIPRGLDDPVRGWHHPVFGHPPNVQERSPIGHWFIETFQDGREEIQDGLHQVLEEAAATVDRLS